MAFNTFLVLALFFISTAHANNFFEDFVSQTVVHPMIEEQKLYVVTPAFGVGSYTSTLSMQNLNSLSNTNSNFYILGLDINGYSTHLFLPFRDKADRRSRSVDSDVFRFQSSFKVSPQITLDGSYTKVIGFYSGSIDDMNSTITKFPDLGFRKYSLIGTYMVNGDHRSSLFSPISYTAAETSQSVFYSLELNHHELVGLDSLNPFLNKPDPQEKAIQSAKFYSSLLSIGWSQSKLYQNFFWSYAIGVGIGGSFVEKFYVNQRANENLITTTVPVSALIGWNQGAFTTGLFLMTRSWAANIDQYQINNSTGYVGLQLAYRF